MDGDTGTLSDPLLRAQSQHVDDVGPIVSSLVPVAEQVGGDRVAVRLIVDQNAAEPSAGLRIEHLEQRTEVAVSHGPSPKGSTQPPRPGADRKDEGHQRDEHDRHRDQPFLPDHRAEPSPVRSRTSAANPYSLQIRSHPSNDGKRVPVSNSRYSRTL